jgi:ferredoxin
MPSWTTPNNEQSATAEPLKENEVVPPRPENEPYYPAVPIPAAYRSSVGVVNGEVVGVAVDKPTEQYAHYPIPPLSAGLKTSRTIYSTYEEQRVAELEDKVHEEDRKDLVKHPQTYVALVVNDIAGCQAEGTFRESCVAKCKLCLQVCYFGALLLVGFSDSLQFGRSFDGSLYFRHFQRNPISPCAKWSPTVVNHNANMASDHYSCHSLYFARHVAFHYVQLLEGRPQQS